MTVRTAPRESGVSWPLTWGAWPGCPALVAALGLAVTAQIGTRWLSTPSGLAMPMRLLPAMGGNGVPANREREAGGRLAVVARAAPVHACPRTGYQWRNKGLLLRSRTLRPRLLHAASSAMHKVTHCSRLPQVPRSHGWCRPGRCWIPRCRHSPGAAPKRKIKPARRSAMRTTPEQAVLCNLIAFLPWAAQGWQLPLFVEYACACA